MDTPQIQLQGIIRDPEAIPRGGTRFLLDIGPMKLPLVAWNQTARTVMQIGDGTRVTVQARPKAKAWNDAKGQTRWHLDLVAFSIRYESAARGGSR